MQWELSWKDLSRRISVWSATAEIFVRQLEHIRSSNNKEAANLALCREANFLVGAIQALELPPDLDTTRADVVRTLGPVFHINSGWDGVAHRWAVLAALRAPLDEALSKSEEPRRRLIDRAFLHLKRTLAVDKEAQKRWLEAFKHETRCEQLGALHLLSHGVYSFKADAGSGRTDLILNESLNITNEVRAAEAMVLTEWKRVRPKDNIARVAAVGREQVAGYASNELGGFELRKHQYVVLVSRKQCAVPEDETLGDVTLHYVNIPIRPIRPSEHARRATSQRQGRGRRPSSATGGDATAAARSASRPPPRRLGRGPRRAPGRHHVV